MEQHASLSFSIALQHHQCVRHRQHRNNRRVTYSLLVIIQYAKIRRIGATGLLDYSTPEDVLWVSRVTGEEYAAMLSASGLESAAPGTVLSDGKTYLAVVTADGAISVTELQMAGKKKMAVKDFLIGFREPESYGTTQGTSSQITGKHA